MRFSPLRTVLTLVTVSLLTIEPAGAAGGRIVWATVEHRHNVSNSAQGLEQHTDLITTVAARRRGSRATGEHQGIFWDGRLSLTHYHEYDDLDAAAISVSAGHRWQLGSGFRGPWLDIHLAADGRAHRNSALRNHGGLEAGALLGSDLTDRVQLKAGYRFDLKRGLSDDVLDTESHRLFLNVDLRLTPRTVFYMTASGQRGDVVSSAPETLGLSFAASQTSTRADDAFGLDPAGIPLRAYQIEADTLSFDVGMSWMLNERSSIDLGASYFRTWTHRFTNYDGNSVALTFFHQPTGAR